MSIRLLLALACFSWCLSLVGQSFDPQQLLPEDTSIQVIELPNGFRIFLKAHDEPRDRLELRLVVKAGSLQEEADQLGVAHFVEHMAFNGTEHFEQNTLIDFIEQNGSRFGADLNASTSFTETIYKLEVKSDSLALVDTALQIMADWAGGVTFEPEEVDKERGIIRSEWRSGLSSQQRLQLQAYDELLQGSRYAERLPIGSPALIDTVNAQRLLDYYRRWYQPANMSLIVVGQADMEWIAQRARELFHPLQNQEFAPAPTYPLSEKPRQRFLLATDDEAPFTRWEITWQLGRDTATNSYGYLRRQQITQIFGRILNKRLAALREEQVPPFTFASSGFSGLPGQYDAYRISAMCEPDEVMESLALLTAETKRFLAYGASSTELEVEKTAISERVARMIKELDKRPSDNIAAGLVNTVLQNSTYPDLAQFDSIITSCLATIELKDLQQALADALQSDIQTVIISSNTEHAAQFPDSLQFYHQLDSLWQIDVAAQEQEVALGPLLELPNTNGSYQLMEVDTVLGLSTYQLSNGIEVYVKPTDFQNDQIQFQAFSTGGQSKCTDEEFASARHCIAILNESGLDTFKESELLQILSGEQVQLGPYIGTYEEGLSGASNQEDLETMLQLAYLYFTRPRFDSLVLASYLDRQYRIFERINTDPRTAFGRMVVDLKYDEHLRRPNITLAELAQIDLATCERNYRERFADANDFRLIFVGNIDEDTLLTMVEKHLGVLPTLPTEESWEDHGLRLHSAPLDTLVSAGQTPKVEVMLEWHSPFNYADKDERLHYSALRQMLSIRLRELLREDMGGVYGVRVNARFQSIPDSLQHVSIRFNAEPDEYESLIAQIQAEIIRLANGEIPDEIIPKIKATRIKSYEEALRENSFWMSQIKQCLAKDYDWEVLYPGYYQDRLETLNEEDLALMVKKYILEAIPFRFVLLPEEGILENAE
jgi:zinc protease